MNNTISITPDQFRLNLIDIVDDRGRFVYDNIEYRVSDYWSKLLNSKRLKTNRFYKNRFWINRIGQPPEYFYDSNDIEHDTKNCGNFANLVSRSFKIDNFLRNE